MGLASDKSLGRAGINHHVHRPESLQRRRASLPAAPDWALNVSDARCSLREQHDPFCSLGVSLGRGALVETQRLAKVLWHALAACVTSAEVGERCVALRRGEAPPLDGFIVRLRHAPAVVAGKLASDSARGPWSHA